MNKFNYTPLVNIPFGESSAIITRSLAQYESEIAAYLPNLYSIEYSQNNELFQSKTFSTKINDMEIFAISGAKSKMTLSSQSNELSLFLPYKGQTRYYSGNNTFDAIERKSACLIKHLTAGEDYQKTSGVALKIDLEKLQNTFELMTKESFETTKFDSEIPLEIQLQYGDFSFYESLNELYMMIERYRKFDGMMESFAIDDLFYRNITMMLFPEKFIKYDSKSLDKKTAHKAMKYIIEFANEYPRELLKLSDLERISGVSARSLQYIFKAELDCTPTQWLKIQRLKFVHSLLSDKNVNINITNASHLAGFTNYSLFSKYYFQLFNELPSQTHQKVR